MSLLKTVLENGGFAVTAEMAPPKGYDVSHPLEVAELLRGKVHGINVTDMQSACLKASGLGNPSCKLRDGTETVWGFWEMS